MLTEKQFELGTLAGGGVAFGLGALVAVKSDGWRPGQAELTNGDSQRQTRDGVRFGIDRRGSATWGFSLFTDADSEEEAWAALGELEAAWNDEEIRRDPDLVVPLRYCLLGEVRRVYGRPRRWSADPDNLSLSGRIDITADFATTDDLVYEDIEQSKTIPLRPPVSLGYGLRVPFRPAARLSANPAERQTTITVGGTVPTPIVLEIAGGVRGAKVVVQNRWTAQLIDPVAYDDVVTLDPRPWVNAATRRNGDGVRLSPRVTRLAALWLPKGSYDVVFSGEATGGSPAVTVRWRNAHRRKR